MLVSLPPGRHLIRLGEVGLGWGTSRKRPAGCGEGADLRARRPADSPQTGSHVWGLKEVRCPLGS